MCVSKPNVPDAPPALQQAQVPDAASLKKKRPSSMTGGTLLTSPTGIAGSALNTGAPTLLGG